MFLPQVVPLSGVHAGHLTMFTVKCALSFACSWLWKFLELPWPGTLQKAPQPGPCLELLSRPWVAERKTTQVKCHFHDTPSMQLNTGGWLWVSGWGSAGSSCPSTLYFLEGSCEVPATSKEWRVLLFLLEMELWTTWNSATWESCLFFPVYLFNHLSLYQDGSMVKL